MCFADEKSVGCASSFSKVAKSLSQKVIRFLHVEQNNGRMVLAVDSNTLIDLFQHCWQTVQLLRRTFDAF